MSYLLFRKETLKAGCMRCPVLCKNRKQIVFDRLSPHSDEATVMFVGEAPGVSEDYSGQAFIGRSGKFLDQLIDYLGVIHYIITNVIKCRPPKNRAPTNREIENCSPFLQTQIGLSKPKIIVLLGRTAVTYFLPNTVMAPMKDLVSVPFYLKNWNGITLIPFYHPAYILRNQQRQQEFAATMRVLKFEIQDRLEELCKIK